MFNHRERKKMAHKLRGKHDLKVIQKQFSISKWTSFFLISLF